MLPLPIDCKHGLETWTRNADSKCGLESGTRHIPERKRKPENDEHKNKRI